MIKELIMLDEQKQETITNSIVVSFSNNCIVKGNIIEMPIEEALSYATNILVQLEFINDKG